MNEEEQEEEEEEEEDVPTTIHGQRQKLLCAHST